MTGPYEARDDQSMEEEMEDDVCGELKTPTFGGKRERKPQCSRFVGDSPTIRRKRRSEEPTFGGTDVRRKRCSEEAAFDDQNVASSDASLTSNCQPNPSRRSISSSIAEPLGQLLDHSSRFYGSSQKVKFWISERARLRRKPYAHA